MPAFRSPHLTRPRSEVVAGVSVLLVVVGLFWCFRAIQGMSSLAGLNLELNLYRNCQADLTSFYRHANEKAPLKTLNDDVGRLDHCKESLLKKYAPRGLEAQKDVNRRKALKFFLDNLYQLGQEATGQGTPPPGRASPALSEKERQVSLLGYYLNVQEALSDLQALSSRPLAKLVWTPFQLILGLLVLLLVAGFWVYNVAHQGLARTRRLGQLFSLFGGISLAIMGVLALGGVWTLGVVQRPGLQLYGADWELASLLDGVKNATLDFEEATGDALGAPAGSDKEKRYDLALNTFLKTVDKVKTNLGETPQDQEIAKSLEDAHKQFAELLIGARQLAGQSPPRLKEANEKIREARESAWRADLLQLPARFYASRNHDYQETRAAIHRRSLLFSILAFLALIGGGGATFLWRRLLMERIVSPLKEFEGATTELRLGHFDHPVVHLHDDEMGQLARSLEGLRVELSQRLETASQPMVRSLSDVLGEDATEEMKERLLEHLALEQVDEGVLLFSHEGAALFANQAALRILGFNHLQELSHFGADLFDEATARTLLDHAEGKGEAGALDLLDVPFGQDRILNLSFCRVTGAGVGGWLLRARDNTGAARLMGDLRTLNQSFAQIRGQWETLVAFLSHLPEQGGLKDRWRVAPTTARAEWCALYLLQEHDDQLHLTGRSAQCPALMEEWPQNTPGPFGLPGRLDQPPVVVDLEDGMALAAISFGDKRQAGGLLLVAAAKDSPLFSPAMMAVLAEEAAVSTLATLVEQLKQQQGAWEQRRQRAFEEYPEALVVVCRGEGQGLLLNRQARALLGEAEIPPATALALADALSLPPPTAAALENGDQAALAGFLAAMASPAVFDFTLLDTQHLPLTEEQKDSPTWRLEKAVTAASAPPEQPEEVLAQVPEPQEAGSSVPPLSPPPSPVATPGETPPAPPQAPAEAAPEPSPSPAEAASPQAPEPPSPEEPPPPPEPEPAPTPEPAPEPASLPEPEPESPAPTPGTAIKNVITQAVARCAPLAQEKNILLLPQASDVFSAASQSALAEALGELLLLALERTPPGSMVPIEASTETPWVVMTVISDAPIFSDQDWAALTSDPNGALVGHPLMRWFQARQSAAGAGAEVLARPSPRGGVMLLLHAPQMGCEVTAQDRAGLSPKSGMSAPGQAAQDAPAPAPKRQLGFPAGVDRTVFLDFQGISSQRLERHLRDREFSVLGQSGGECPPKALCCLKNLDPDQLFSRHEQETPLVPAHVPLLLVPGLSGAMSAALPLPPLWMVADGQGWRENVTPVLSRLFSPQGENTALVLHPGRKQREEKAAFLRELGFQVMEADSARKAQLIAEAAPPTVLLGSSVLSEADSLLLLELLKHPASLGAAPLILDQFIPREFSRRERLRIALNRFVERHPLPFKEMATQVHNHLLRLARPIFKES